DAIEGAAAFVVVRPPGDAVQSPIDAAVERAEGPRADLDRSGRVAGVRRSVRALAQHDPLGVPVPRGRGSRGLFLLPVTRDRGAARALPVPPHLQLPADTWLV